MKNDAGKYDSYSDGGLPLGPYQEPASSRVVPTSKAVDEHMDCVMRICQKWGHQYAFVGDAAYPRGREELRAALSAPLAPTTESRLIFPNPIDIVAAMTEKAKARTSAENIADVLLALATAGMAPPDGGGRGLTDAEITAAWGRYDEGYSTRRELVERIAAAIDRARGGVL